jgi:ATP-dependent protease ClpP protease subunit
VLKLKNNTGSPVLEIFGEIGGFWGGVTTSEVSAILRNVGDHETLVVEINSGGGDYFEGIGIHSKLSARSGATHVSIVGLAASAASVIAMAGDEITMATGSQMMIHEVHVGAYGTAAEVEKAAAVARQSSADLLNVYRPRWKGSDKELQAAIAAETWFTAESAIEVGLADRVSGNYALAASCDLTKFNYKHVPQLAAASGPHWSALDAQFQALQTRGQYANVR